MFEDTDSRGRMRNNVLSFLLSSLLPISTLPCSMAHSNFFVYRPNGGQNCASADDSVLFRVFG